MAVSSPKQKSWTPMPSRISSLFQQVAPQVHFCPNRKVKTWNTQDPELILLFTWTSAQPRHIVKYTTKYINLYLDSAIMVITTSFKDLIHYSTTRKHRSMNPALRILLAEKLTANILVHCFSEGGSMKACEFAKFYLKTHGSCLQISSLCLDSTPGTIQTSHIPSMWKAITPNGMAVKVASSTTGYVFTALYQIRTKYLFADARRALDDETLWDPRVPRCYLYSEADQLVEYHGIIQHSDEARKRGTPVIMVPFVASAHCAHTKEDPNKYWDAIKKTWSLRTRPSQPYQGGGCS